MSILVAHIVPQGILFAADRNITTTVARQGTGTVTIVQGQSQRPKVLKWPNKEVIIGYVGAAAIYGEAMDKWLYHTFIGRNLTTSGLDSLASSLTGELNRSMNSGDIEGPLIIHLAGFELIAGEWSPRIWFIRNTTALTPTGEYVLGQAFECSEEISRPEYFGSSSGNQIRRALEKDVNQWGYFSFRQGWDLGAFNTLDKAMHMAMRSIVENHPQHCHPFPTSLEEWAKHVKMAVLAYGAYFEAFYEPFEQFVGGGADVVWAEWPSS